MAAQQRLNLHVRHFLVPCGNIHLNRLKCIFTSRITCASEIEEKVKK